jgi:tetratricopeptide (TPR) repeat protein/CHAT domain-containing protein
VYESVGDFGSALPLYQKALGIYRRVFGEEHPAYAASLNNLGSLYHSIGDLNAALPMLEKALDIRQRILGEEHPDYGASLNGLALLHHSMGDYQSALSLHQKALENCRRFEGEHDPNYAGSLNNLGELYKAMGRYEEALPLLKQALKICRRVQGKDHPNYPLSLNNLAGLYFSMGRYKEALPLLKQALEIRRGVLGENHPYFAASLNNLAELYKAMGDYEASLPLLHQALIICQKVLGEDHSEYAACLSNLAGLFQMTGDYASALPLLQQAKEINQHVLGENHSDYAKALSNLAHLYDLIGDYKAALPLAEQALELCQKVLGENHPQYSASLNNLAGLYVEIGDHQAALPLLRKAVEIRKCMFGVDHPRYATSLANLAFLYFEISDYEAAISPYQEALTIHRRVLGEDHPEYAQILNNFAGFCELMGDHKTGVTLYQQVLEICRRRLGKDHPDYGSTLNNLAGLYHSMGDYETALPLMQQATKICWRTHGKDHPSYAKRLQNLASLVAGMGRTAEAFSLMERAAGIETMNAFRLFGAASSRQREAYFDSLDESIHALVSLASKALKDSPRDVAKVLDVVLSRKAILAEALAVQWEEGLAGRHPQLKSLIEELRVLQEQIARKLLDWPAEGVAEHKRLLSRWTARKESLEKKLAHQIPEMDLKRRLRSADHRALARALPVDTILAEFVRFDVVDFTAATARGEKRWEPPHYAAFIIRGGQPKKVKMIDLGEAKYIDGMIAKFRKVIIEGHAYVEKSTSGWPDTEQPAEEVGQQLREAVFDPIIADLDGNVHVILSPDGELSYLPFEVLPSEQGGYVVDNYQISYVSVGRDVLRLETDSFREPSVPVVVADPDYDLEETIDEGSSSSVDDQDFGRASALSRDLKRGESYFKRLPGSRIEGIGIAKRLGITPWLGEKALEARVKAVRSPQILHLSTHGYFLPDQERAPNGEIVKRDRANGDSEGFWGRLRRAQLENPLLRSFLVFAGVNTWARNGRLPEPAEDGILTAEDVSGMDLLDTELVVLSGCDTALGDVKAGEGVLGLRRSFAVAGAKTLVITLWKVPDFSTAILMEQFYENLLTARLSRLESLKKAKLHLRTLTVGDIRDRWLKRDSIDAFSGEDEKSRDYLEQIAVQSDEFQPFADPYFWGAFVCQGDPGPLKGYFRRTDHRFWVVQLLKTWWKQRNPWRDRSIALARNSQLLDLTDPNSIED